MRDQPTLLAVPAFINSLTIKADLNGITVLKEGRFKKRYVGSKQYEVDINGILRKKSEMKLLLKKEGTGPPDRPLKNKKPTLTKLARTYTINKPEIRARIYSLIATQAPDQKELYFWTVTFPGSSPDGVIYRMFNTWLTKLRQKGLLKNYLWVAERQQNGTLHFHLAVPHKMPVKVANREMMITLCKAASAGEIPTNIHLCKRYNGVDICKARAYDSKGKTWIRTKQAINFARGRAGRRSLTGYLTKYVTKNDGNFTGLAWHNSRGFSMLFTGVTFTYDESREKFNWRFFAHSRPAFQTDFFWYFPWINGPPSNLEGELIKLNSFIQNLN